MLFGLGLFLGGTIGFAIGVVVSSVHSVAKDYERVVKMREKKN